MNQPDGFQSITRWLESLTQFLDRVKDHWKWVGRILTVVAVLYVGVLIVTSWDEIQTINWQNYLLVIFLALFIYLFSLMLQLFAWLRLLSHHHKVGWHDVEIYTHTIMLRQIPGGVWHWLGRSTMYQSSTTVSGKTVLFANMLDWCFILVTAFGVYGLFATDLAFSFRGALVIFSFVMMMLIARTWFASKRKGYQLLEGFLLLIAYTGSWIMGGIILFLFIRDTPNAHISFSSAITVWAIAGGISAITIIAPSGLGIRELSLTFFLQPFVPLAFSIVLALLMRFTFTFADFIWGSSGWMLSRKVLNRKKGTNNPEITPSGY